MVYVAGACGLRFSEVAGLRVRRVDIAHHQLQATETAPQVGGDRTQPKTAAGRRTVPLPGLIAKILKEHLSRYGLAGEPDALVFSAARGGRLTPPTGTSVPGSPLDAPPGYPR